MNSCQPHQLCKDWGQGEIIFFLVNSLHHSHLWDSDSLRSPLCCIFGWTSVTACSKPTQRTVLFVPYWTKYHDNQQTSWWCSWNNACNPGNHTSELLCCWPSTKPLALLGPSSLESTKIIGFKNGRTMYHSNDVKVLMDAHLPTAELACYQSQQSSCSSPYWLHRTCICFLWVTASV